MHRRLWSFVMLTALLLSSRPSEARRKPPRIVEEYQHKYDSPEERAAANRAREPGTTQIAVGSALFATSYAASIGFGLLLSSDGAVEPKSAAYGFIPIFGPMFYLGGGPGGGYAFSLALLDGGAQLTGLILLFNGISKHSERGIGSVTVAPLCARGTTGLAFTGAF